MLTQLGSRGKTHYVDAFLKYVELLEESQGGTLDVVLN